jgi:coniferyl-aldehyde dehydrogenase
VATTTMTLQDQFDAMRRSHAAAGPPDVAIRRDRLDRLQAMLASNAPALADALCSDYGTRSMVQTLGGEGLGTAFQVAHSRRRLHRWMRPQRRWVGAGFAAIGGRARIEWQPLGVVGIISPWNYPVALTLGPLGQALAAGNRALCKVSELTPATAKVLQDAVLEWFEEDEVGIVTGGADVGAEFTRLPFDHLFFTGSGAVGREVMRAAAENLTPVTLELGGKSPLVVGPNAPLGPAARTVMFGKSFNAGQFCVAPDRVFVPEHRVDDFIAACHRAASAADPLSEPTAIVNAAHRARLGRLLDDAQTKGASVVHFGTPPGPDEEADRVMAPTAVLGIDDTMAIAHEEVFGPLFSIHPYRKVDDVIDEVQAGPEPLAAYWFGPTGADLDRFVARTASGGVVVNDIILQVGLEHLPFGGIGQSGTGAYHGRAGFETFSHAKPVVRSPRPLTPMLSPPYPAMAERAVRFIIGRSARRYAKRATPRGPAARRSAP